MIKKDSALPDRMATVEKIFQNRAEKARELKAQGKKIIGYMCNFVPVEIISAAGLVPFRITGDVNEAITVGDKYLETTACPYVRSFIDIAMKGRYDFLDGLVMTEVCECVTKAYDILTYNLKPSYAHYVVMPHLAQPASFKFLGTELARFREGLEGKFNVEISDELLRENIQAYNRNRALLRKLYELRKQAPPPISGAEMTKVIIAQMSLPPEESHELLKSVLREVQERNTSPAKKRARVLIYGWALDDPAFADMVETSGADVVIDDACVGLRSCRYDTRTGDDPLDDLALYYLESIPCPRMYREKVTPHEADLKSRFGYLGELAEQYNVDGVIMHVPRFCDIFALSAVDLKDYLESIGLPVLLLQEYFTESLPRARVRLEAFFEMVRQEGGH